MARALHVPDRKQSRRYFRMHGREIALFVRVGGQFVELRPRGGSQRVGWRVQSDADDFPVSPRNACWPP